MLLHRRLILLILILLTACSPSATTQTTTELAPSPEAFPSPTIVYTPSATAKLDFPKPTPTKTNTPDTTPPSPTPTPTSQAITTLLFSGVIVPARCVQAAIDRLGDPDYPYAEVKDIIQSADLAVGVFNATMSDKAEHTGCVRTYQLVGSPDNADALQRAGFDLMSVATNHIKDCGVMKSWCEVTFFDTLHHLQRVGILTVGAGENLDAALQPAVVTLNGVRFAFVSLGDSKLSETVFATETHPGIARLTEENMRTAIELARQAADVVIALPHWGSEYNLLPNWNQHTQALYTVQAGADLVVGNHTHVVQAYQQIQGVMVFYGLGNFVFDQGLRETRQGVMLIVRFKGAQFLDYKFIPTHVDGDGRVHIAGDEEAQEILERIRAASELLD